MIALHAIILVALAVPPEPKPASDGSATAGPLRPRLEMIDAGVEDRGGIEKSFRVMPLDLRLPTGFTGVFRVPGSADRMMRGNGALFAVFPRSQYRRFGNTLLPIPPADVHYSIGMPGGFSYPGGSLRPFGSSDAEVRADESPVSGARRVDGRVRLNEVAEAPAAQTAARTSGPVNMMPAICEAPLARAVSTATGGASPRLLTLADLQLGPACVERH